VHFAFPGLLLAKLKPEPSLSLPCEAAPNSPIIAHNRILPPGPVGMHDAKYIYECPVQSSLSLSLSVNGIPPLRGHPWRSLGSPVLARAKTLHHASPSPSALLPRLLLLLRRHLGSWFALHSELLTEQTAVIGCILQASFHAEDLLWT